ncbi:C-type lectin domain family 2 member D-like [Sphaerodactylus townsendi]|uniref:C-type lectin domain family 2 member D-like n=1 Tax=Sphaerodactylus townsendi TaxID=933632 RepID=UPI002025E4B0|nr:C-type lectin domain family 2 member D-like [Sphaerodactylus townsendi]
MGKQKAVIYKVAFVIVIVILSIVIIVLAVKIHQQQSHESVSPIPDCSPCPSDWPQYGGICYYFSTGERNWTSAQDFCSSHNASLTRIENKYFVMRYRGKLLYWIGLTRKDSGQPWKWLNGDPATLEVLGEGGNCAYLSDEQEVKASVSRCSTEHHWICSRPVVMMPSLGGWV